MATLRVTSLRGRTAGTSPELPDGAVVTGVVTATSFVGSGEGLTGVASTDNIVTGTAATFTGSVNITGITTVGVLTAYTSIKVGTAITMDATSGIVTATSFSGDGSGLTNAGDSAAKSSAIALFLGR